MCGIVPTSEKKSGAHLGEMQPLSGASATAHFVSVEEDRLLAGGGLGIRHIKATPREHQPREEPTTELVRGD